MMRTILRPKILRPNIMLRKLLQDPSASDGPSWENCHPSEKRVPRVVRGLICRDGYGGLPPGSGVVNNHTFLSYEGDNRKMPGGGVGNNHTLLSH